MSNCIRLTIQCLLLLLLHDPGDAVARVSCSSLVNLHTLLIRVSCSSLVNLHTLLIRVSCSSLVNLHTLLIRVSCSSLVNLHTLLICVMCVASCNVIFSSLQSFLIMSIHRFFGLPDSMNIAVACYLGISSILVKCSK